ncbi:hypothetical protein I79_020818 [Cricetulus griseus]|uniref:Uncharacterized protein n=1 Tax=Cricetulus griseus TaxID=10029 RepID=G3IB30_CRIGR|nr:hypothetical protein I79_020818 [Cricetulus griseus]
MVDGAVPGLLVLGSIRRWVGQTSKQLTSMASTSASVSRFQPCLSSCPDFPR